MSYLEPNSQQRPFYEGPNQYSNNYNNSPRNATISHYNNSHNFSSRYCEPVVAQSGSSTSSTVNSQNASFNGSQFPYYDDQSYSQSMVFESKLTPLANEFKPGSSTHATIESDTRNQGAIRKDYQQRNKRFNNDRRYNNGENVYSRNRTFYPNQRYNNSNSFNKNSEKNEILQHTKKFLQQFKNTEDNQKGSEETENQNYIRSRDIEKSNMRKDYNNMKLFNVKSGKPSGYYKANNSRSYRNTNKQDYYDYENRSRDNERWKRNDTGETSSFDKKKYDRENGQKMEYEKKKIVTEVFDKKKSDLNLKKKLDAASQRERLEQLIIRRLLECLVCCEKLRHTDQVWSCKQCYHVLHLNCTIRWAQSSKLESGWRCPACQNVYQDVPKAYRCYCEKQINPTLDPGGIPHSCGAVCGRKGRSCSHNCTLICHPGPCPDCSITIPKSCGCGATKPIVKCSSTVPITCQKLCSKVLNCDIHICNSKCHEGDCQPCANVLKQECYCGKEGRKVNCTKEANGDLRYECGEQCDKMLSCGNHRCERKCHSGPCNTCSKSPNIIRTCPCGQKDLVQVRNSCLDPIPCCDKMCSKKLNCGQPSAPHICKASCHPGGCPPCPETTLIRCRCGHMDKEMLCTELTSKADDARCEKKCVRKRLCGKHKCNQLCCIEIDHVCPLPCNRPLSCGLHRCVEPCHKGRCQPCWRTSFDELYCECGSSVLYPPVACGTRPPPCDQICSRSRPCEHDALHSCHSGQCPPCTVLTKRWCHGKHEQRSTIPCHQNNFSCGLPCGKDMACGKHKCQQPCHEGSCRMPCNQPCNEVRNECGHPCSQPCHSPPCPETPCKHAVQVTCPCGLRKSTRICMDLVAEYQIMDMSQIASKMEQMQMGQRVDITDLGIHRKGPLKTLDCNDECRLVERNRRLAIGLQIRNPDLSSKLTPRYSEYMRNWAKKDPKFCQQIHERLTELVQLAKQSKQKSRAYSFETMNRDKRHFVHEYCEHFGCDSAAYDPEPNRNVVATAYKDKSWLPSYSLLEIIQRESGQRKVPGPQQLGKGLAAKPETVSLKLPGRIPRPATPPGEYVDYFNNPPE